jgi:hypothetical protein
VDQHKEAMNHFVVGKRHLLVKDISAAVTSLGQVRQFHNHCISFSYISMFFSSFEVGTDQ